jgi:hypothetical protein
LRYGAMRVAIAYLLRKFNEKVSNNVECLQRSCRAGASR